MYPKNLSFRIELYHVDGVLFFLVLCLLVSLILTKTYANLLNIKMLLQHSGYIELVDFFFFFFFQVVFPFLFGWGVERKVAQIGYDLRDAELCT